VSATGTASRLTRRQALLAAAAGLVTTVKVPSASAAPAVAVKGGGSTTAEAFVRAVAASPAFAAIPARPVDDVLTELARSADFGESCEAVVAFDATLTDRFFTLDVDGRREGLRRLVSRAMRSCTPTERVVALQVDALVQAVVGCLLPPNYPLSLATYQI
jgi:hypothetical protein